MGAEGNIIDTDFTSYGEWLIFAYARQDGAGGVAKAHESIVGRYGEMIALLLALRENRGPGIIRCDCITAVLSLNNFCFLIDPEHPSPKKLRHRECQRLMEAEGFEVIYRPRTSNPAHKLARAARSRLSDVVEFTNGKTRTFRQNFTRSGVWYMVTDVQGHRRLYSSFHNAKKYSLPGETITPPLRRDLVPVRPRGIVTNFPDCMGESLGKFLADAGVLVWGAS